MLTVLRHKSGIVAIDVRFLFEHAVCHAIMYFRCLVYRKIKKRLL
jgi:hypothetical protein